MTRPFFLTLRTALSLTLGALVFTSFSQGDDEISASKNTAANDPQPIFSKDPRTQVISPKEVGAGGANVTPILPYNAQPGDYGFQQRSKIACKNESPDCTETYTVNFENISVIELIRFISQISNTNFIFNNEDLQFPITIVSQDCTTVHELMAALLQILRMHNLSVIEQGKNILIYNNNSLSRMSSVVTEDNVGEVCDRAVVTRVFRLYNIAAENAGKIIAPLVSKDAIVEVSPETSHLIVSDITVNVDKVADLLNALDTPNAALDIAEYNVKSAYPQALVAYAKEILGPIAQMNPIQMIAQPSAHKIFIVSTPYLISKAVTVLQSLDTVEIANVIDLPPSALVNSNFFVYKLKYQEGDKIADAIRQIGQNLQFLGVSNIDLINTIYALEWIEVNNSIVITGTQESIDKVVQLINDLDVAPDQVYIEVLIIDTTLANSLTFGVEWVALGDEQNKLAYASGLLATPNDPLLQGATTAFTNPPPSPTSIPILDPNIVSQGFGFGILGNVIRHNGQSLLTLGALINAVESDSDTVIVLNPRIMAEDTTRANFFVGSNIPYQTTSTVVRDTGSVTQNIQYEDIGVNLTVTPQVGPDRTVTLDIIQSVSSVTSATSTISSGGGSATQVLLAPTTSKTLTTTRVHVPDGVFLVMSGHIFDQAVQSRYGIPCLGTLPWIGPAFSTNTETRTKRNLIMFIRPRVIRVVPEGLRVTNQEGYDYNWESNPCSIFDCGPKIAPECEKYPPRICPNAPCPPPNILQPCPCPPPPCLPCDPCLLPPSPCLPRP